jgi:hypothetical protein
MVYPIGTVVKVISAAYEEDKALVGWTGIVVDYLRKDAVREAYKGQNHLVMFLQEYSWGEEEGGFVHSLHNGNDVGRVRNIGCGERCWWFRAEVLAPVSARAEKLFRKKLFVEVL